MLAERPKLSVKPTFCQAFNGSGNRSGARRVGMVAFVVAMLGAATCLSGTTVARDFKFASPQAAYEQGFSAYKNGFYEIAIPALSSAATTLEPSKRLFAEFYLAQIYADNTGTQTDHTKAYTLFRSIVEAHADIDPDDRLRAPFVARSLTAVANYVRRGIPDFGLQSDPETALDFYNKAATWFDEPDAQFELAKLHLIGEGVPQDVKLGLHYLQKLVHQSHAPAQAFLADLQWQGKIVPREPDKALALIRMAVENAHRTDRLWIDDIYHKVYCGTTKDVRANSDGLVMRWKQLFARPRFEEAPSALGVGDLKPSRICRNGEPLKEIERGASGIGGGIVDAINAFSAPLTPRADTRPIGSPAPQR